VIKDYPRVYKENFAQNGVASRHSVTFKHDCVQTEGTTATEPLTTVHRCYQPEGTYVDALVEALFRLIVDEPSKQNSTCFFTTPE
jgi:hypothetical protein